MIRDAAGSKDGWFWGEWYTGMTFDENHFPSTIRRGFWNVFHALSRFGGERHYF